MDSISVPGGGLIELGRGDLSTLSEKDEVEVLVISAFRGDYTPTPSSLIGALDRRGISVSELATNKYADLRVTTSSWYSHVLDPSLAGFRRLLCYEPATAGTASETVGDVFRALIAGLPNSGDDLRVAMPILASGNMGRPVSEMLPAILDAAVHWLERARQLQTVSIVTYGDGAPDADVVFRDWAARNKAPTVPDQTTEKRYDFFVSYSWEDGSDAMQSVFNALKELNSSVKVFVDRLELDPGAAWQQRIAEALEGSRKVVLLLTPGFLNSRSCTEEWNMAWLLDHRSSRPVLCPLLTLDAELPLYMAIFQYRDCRPSDPNKIREACKSLLTELDS